MSVLGRIHQGCCMNTMIIYNCTPDCLYITLGFDTITMIIHSYYAYLFKATMLVDAHNLLAHRHIPRAWLFICSHKWQPITCRFVMSEETVARTSTFKDSICTNVLMRTMSYIPVLWWRDILHEYFRLNEWGNTHVISHICKSLHVHVIRNLSWFMGINNACIYACNLQDTHVYDA